MRLSLILLLISLAGVLGGAAIIGLPVLGGAVIFESLCAGAWGLLRDDGREEQARPGVYGVPSLHDVLEKARGAA
jgi:hypothetical protein